MSSQFSSSPSSRTSWIPKNTVPGPGTYNTHVDTSHRIGPVIHPHDRLFPQERDGGPGHSFPRDCGTDWGSGTGNSSATVRRGSRQKETMGGVGNDDDDNNSFDSFGTDEESEAVVTAEEDDPSPHHGHHEFENDHSQSKKSAPIFTISGHAIDDKGSTTALENPWSRSDISNPAVFPLDDRAGVGSLHSVQLDDDYEETLSPQALQPSKRLGNGYSTSSDSTLQNEPATSSAEQFVPTTIISLTTSPGSTEELRQVRLQSVPEDDSPFAWLTRSRLAFVGVGIGICTFIFGIIQLILWKKIAGCIVAGLWLMLFGVVVLIVEGMHIPRVQILSRMVTLLEITRIIDNRPNWLKCIFYLILGIVPLAICQVWASICGAVLFLVFALLYGFKQWDEIHKRRKLEFHLRQRRPNNANVPVWTMSQ